MAADYEFIIRMLERLDEKTDSLLEKHHEGIAELTNITSRQNSLLAEYNQSLQEHMRRTDLLEQRVQPLETDLETREIAKDLRSARLKKWGATVAIISAAAAATWSIVQIGLVFKWF